MNKKRRFKVFKKKGFDKLKIFLILLYTFNIKTDK